MSQSTANLIRGYERWWIIISAIFIIIIIAGGIVFAFRQWKESEPVEIALSNTTGTSLEVSLSGAVANEGIYTFDEDSSLVEILQGAGGISEGADLAGIQIYVPATSDSSLLEPQKVNINNAEAWLIEALPGIGPTLAQRIVDYRESNGPFRSIDELTDVSGIGSTTLDSISEMITIVD